MSDELKPCPFCGGKARYVSKWNVWTNSESVVCTKCGVVICRDTETDAIAAWNRRASDRMTTRNGRFRTKYGRKVPLCECCGYSIGDLRWKFCPGCGAEVVNHD